MNAKFIIACVVAYFTIIADTCMANQVTNPFFTGSGTAATSWTSSATGAGAAFNHALSAANATITAAGGSTEFYSGCVGVACLTYPFASGTTSGAQQSVATTIGQSYTISFWTYFSTANNATVEIDVYWGTKKIYSGTSVAAAGWSQQTIYLGVAASSSNILTVMIRDDPSYSAVTDVDVEQTGPNLSVSKTSAPICDPVNGNVNPKLIPGANIQYQITTINTGNSSATLTTLTDTLPSNITLDPRLNSGASPPSSCVASNVTNSLSSNGFAMHNGSGTGPGVVPPGLSSDAVTAGVTVSGQTITINFATLAKSGVVAPAAATLAAGSYITVYFNAFVN